MFVFVDIETTGLIVEACVPLELGIVITDNQLEIIDEQSWLWYWPGMNRNIPSYGLDNFVREMHDKSGLWDAIKEFPRYDSRQVERLAMEMLERNNAMDQPMCGSSVHFDRAFLKRYAEQLEGAFLYRNIDISTLKEIFARIDPEVVESRPQPEGRHRVLPDIYDTMAELKHYLKHIGRGVSF
jgi:oligoribonuclease